MAESNIFFSIELNPATWEAPCERPFERPCDRDMALPRNGHSCILCCWWQEQPEDLGCPTWVVRDFGDFGLGYLAVHVHLKPLGDTVVNIILDFQWMTIGLGMLPEGLSMSFSH